LTKLMLNHSTLWMPIWLNVKYIHKPAGFKINFRYGIGLQHVWMVDFSFYPCTFSLHG
jgi:hypothetical protein